MAKVEILHIWDADGEHFISAHANKDLRQRKLYDFAVDHWGEDMPDPEGLGRQEAIDMWIESTDDFYCYEFTTAEVNGVPEAPPEPADSVFLTERELLMARTALMHIELGKLCAALDDPDCQEIKKIANEVDDLHEKLKV